MSDPRVSTIKRDVPLAPLTTMKVGGSAEYFALVGSEEELAAAASEARGRGWSVLVLGGGSNLIVADSGVKGLVLKNEIKGIAVQEEGDRVSLTVGAGEVWDDLVAYTVARGYWGLENLSAIPGTVGATPIQNVGAYGVEVSSVIDSVRAYDLKRDAWVTLRNDECDFAYRDSLFKQEAGKELLITEVTFVLSKAAAPQLHYKDLTDYFAGTEVPTVSEIREAVTAIRSRKFPDLSVCGTAGSFFKNPTVSAAAGEALRRRYPNLPLFPQTDGSVKVALGWILDKACGLKGVREGNVGTHEAQALVLVNYGGATATEVLAFAHRVVTEVRAKMNIDIEIEPTIV